MLRRRLPLALGTMAGGEVLRRRLPFALAARQRSPRRNKIQDLTEIVHMLDSNSHKRYDILNIMLISNNLKNNTNITRVEMLGFDLIL